MIKIPFALHCSAVENLTILIHDLSRANAVLLTHPSHWSESGLGSNTTLNEKNQKHNTEQKQKKKKKQLSTGPGALYFNFPVELGKCASKIPLGFSVGTIGSVDGLNFSLKWSGIMFWLCSLQSRRHRGLGE